MKKNGDNHSKYVRKVQQETQEYVQTLLGENERLRVLLAKMESENRQLAGDLQQARHEQDRLRAEFERYRREQLELQRQLAEVALENQRHSAQYREVEEQNSNLANLYVASYNLHGTLDRKTVLDTILEIVINLIGSEEVAIYSYDAQRERLDLLAAFGLDEQRYGNLPVASSRIGRAVLSGEILLAGQEPGDPVLSEEAHLSACIPLRLENRITGAITIFRLLPQKQGFVALDQELFELLATQAATALYCTELHTRVMK